MNPPPLDNSSKGRMSYFSERFDQFLKDITEIKTDVEKTKVYIENLENKSKEVINEIRTHICEGESWRKAVMGTVVVVILQIVTFAYWFGRTEEKMIQLTNSVDQRFINHEDRIVKLREDLAHKRSR